MTGDLRAGAEGAHQRGRAQDPADGRDRADDHGQPDPVDALGERRAEVARPEVARDARRGAVREEDTEPDDGLEDHRGDAQARELRGAEVTDDGGVREQEQRLGDEGEEGGHRESQDLAVDGLHASNPRNTPSSPAWQAY